MARRRNLRPRKGGKTDGGASWISYSDMMAALLLLFVLVLCYTVYQYFAMLDTKTAELDEKGALLASQQSTLDEQQITLDTQKATLDAQQATMDAQQITLDEQAAELSAQQLALTTKQSELDSALTELEKQQGLLNDQSLTLSEQAQVIQTKESELAAARVELDAKQQELTAKQLELDEATILLGAQQEAMNTQARKLDDLVGVKAKIIRDLSSALSNAKLKATVDRNTGDIVLESAVFFDVGKDMIKEGGRKLLDKFIPLYLGVLLRDEYSGFLGEIIIEGHTDTQGSYLSNLELSQQRALSVAKYCLDISGLSSEQLELLRGILTAKGRSYSNPVYAADGSIDMDASRRVEFKFRLKDSEMINELRTILDGGTVEDGNEGT